MSVDRTLHSKSGVTSKRNVLKRPERIAVMTEAGNFDPENGRPLGLPKTRVKHSKAGQKAKKEVVAEGAEGAAAAPAAAAAAAPAGKEAKKEGKKEAKK